VLPFICIHVRSFPTVVKDVICLSDGTCRSVHVYYTYTGFETYVAAPWKRLVAEVIDTLLFVVLLKAYLPEADLRLFFTLCLTVKLKVPESS
jgi:hypothetical protein